MKQPPNKSVLLDIYTLTFQSCRGKILSKSVMRAWPTVSCYDVLGFPYLIPPALSNASAGGIPLPSAAKKSRVIPRPLSTPESGPCGPLFPAVDNAAIVNWPPQPHNRGQISAS